MLAILLDRHLYEFSVYHCPRRRGRSLVLTVLLARALDPRWAGSFACPKRVCSVRY